MAIDWQEYERNTKLYPNLRYTTQKDNKVRDSHQALNGIIKAVGDPFWDYAYPPNGWRCRCYVVQTAEKATDREVSPDITYTDKNGNTKPILLPEFRVNVGKTGQIFAQKPHPSGKQHPFFALAKSEGKKLAEVMELRKLNAPLNIIHKAENGAEVKMSPFADTSFKELLGNVRDAVLLANEKGFNIDLPAHLDGEIILNHKNPEYIINDKKADRKNPEGENTKNLIKKANKQECEIVVINLSNTTATENEILRDLYKRFKIDTNYPFIKEVIIIDKKRNINIYSRYDIKNKKTK